jgi:hypothetical protein
MIHGDLLVLLHLAALVEGALGNEGFVLRTALRA